MVNIKIAATSSPRKRAVHRGGKFCAFIFFGLILFGAASVSAQPAYPNKQVRVVVAFAPGGIADIAARLIGQALTDRLGQKFYIENRGGAGGVIGAKLVSSAPPDGYTLLVTTSALVVSAVTSQRAVDPRRQLVSVAQIAATPDVFAVNKVVTDKSMMEYLRRQKDGHFTFATAGAGTLEQLTSEYVFKSVGGLQPTHVPFAGGPPAVNALLGRQVDMAVVAFPAAIPFMKKDGGVRLLAVASSKRNSMIPDVPTLAEAGFTNLESSSWISLFAPPGTPAPVINKLSTEINAALNQADVHERLLQLGFDVRTSSQVEFAGYIDSEMEKWSKVVRDTGFTLN